MQLKSTAQLPSVVEILEDNIPRDQLNKRESYFIREMDTLRPKGYNLTTGGDASVPVAETRQRRQSEEKNNPLKPLPKTANKNRGKKRTPEQRAKISAALKGKKKPPEHIANMSIARRGKKLSPEHRAKISKAQKGKPKRKKSAPPQT